MDLVVKLYHKSKARHAYERTAQYRCYKHKFIQVMPISNAFRDNYACMYSM